MFQRQGKAEASSKTCDATLSGSSMMILNRVYSSNMVAHDPADDITIDKKKNDSALSASEKITLERNYLQKDGNLHASNEKPAPKSLSPTRRKRQPPPPPPSPPPPPPHIPTSSSGEGNKRNTLTYSYKATPGSISGRKKRLSATSTNLLKLVGDLKEDDIKDESSATEVLSPRKERRRHRRSSASPSPRQQRSSTKSHEGGNKLDEVTISTSSKSSSPGLKSPRRRARGSIPTIDLENTTSKDSNRNSDQNVGAFVDLLLSSPKRSSRKTAAKDNVRAPAAAASTASTSRTSSSNVEDEEISSPRRKKRSSKETDKKEDSVLLSPSSKSKVAKPPKTPKTPSSSRSRRKKLDGKEEDAREEELKSPRKSPKRKSKEKVVESPRKKSPSSPGAKEVEKEKKKKKKKKSTKSPTKKSSSNKKVKKEKDGADGPPAGSSDDIADSLPTILPLAYAIDYDDTEYDDSDRSSSTEEDDDDVQATPKRSNKTTNITIIRKNAPTAPTTAISSERQSAKRTTQTNSPAVEATQAAFPEPLYLNDPPTTATAKFHKDGTNTTTSNAHTTTKRDNLDMASGTKSQSPSLVDAVATDSISSGLNNKKTETCYEIVARASTAAAILLKDANAISDNIMKENSSGNSSLDAHNTTSTSSTSTTAKHSVMTATTDSPSEKSGSIIIESSMITEKRGRNDSSCKSLSSKSFGGISIDDLSTNESRVDRTSFRRSSMVASGRESIVAKKLQSQLMQDLMKLSDFQQIMNEIDNEDEESDHMGNNEASGLIATTSDDIGASTMTLRSASTTSDEAKIDGIRRVKFPIDDDDMVEVFVIEDLRKRDTSWGDVWGDLYYDEEELAEMKYEAHLEENEMAELEQQSLYGY